jgi:hypothetical protein
MNGWHGLALRLADGGGQIERMVGFVYDDNLIVAVWRHALRGAGPGCAWPWQLVECSLL